MVELSLTDKTVYISAPPPHLPTCTLMRFQMEENDAFPTTNPPMVGMMFIIFAN